VGPVVPSVDSESVENAAILYERVQEMDGPFGILGRIGVALLEPRVPRLRVQQQSERLPNAAAARSSAAHPGVLEILVTTKRTKSTSDISTPLV
jgi:hypothetical protein